MAEMFVGENTIPEVNQIAFDQRAKEIEAEEQKEAEEKEKARKNDNFFMVYKGTGKGSEKIRELIQKNHNAASLFIYISEQMGRDNALVASGKALAEVLGLSEATISRSIKYLIDNNYINRFKSGGSNLFVANPEFVWSAWATGKNSCLFSNSKVLISKNEQDLSVTKRFNIVMEKRREEEAERAEAEQKRRPGRPKKSDVEQTLTPAELEAQGQQRLIA